MKGLAIHVEQLIIIIIAILILLAVVTFFLGLWNPRILIYRAKLTQACQVLQNLGCATEIIDTNQPTSIKPTEVGGKGTGTLSVQEVCGYVLTGDPIGATEDQCLRACTCMHQ